jgi:hypothetical protein
MSKISTSGIAPNLQIKSEHLLRIINALRGEVSNTNIEVSGSVTASFFVGDGSQLTNLPIPSQSVDFIPLSGTISGSPVLGPIEFQGNTGDDIIMLSTNEGNTSNLIYTYTGINGGLGFVSSNGIFQHDISLNEQISLYSTDGTNGVNMQINSSLPGILITNTNTSSLGIYGNTYFGANYTDNTYVQKKYVDDQIITSSANFIPLSGTISGSPVTGDIEFINGGLFSFIGYDPGYNFQFGWDINEEMNLLRLNSQSFSITNNSSQPIATFSPDDGVTQLNQLRTNRIIVNSDTNIDSLFITTFGGAGTSKGITSNFYYGANYDDNTYVQKKYVDDKIIASGSDNVYTVDGTITGNRNISLGVNTTSGFFSISNGTTTGGIPATGEFQIMGIPGNNTMLQAIDFSLFRFNTLGGSSSLVFSNDDITQFNNPLGLELTLPTASIPNQILRATNISGNLEWSNEIVEKVTTDSYVGDRLQPTDPSINGFYLNVSRDERTGIEVYNQSSTTNATSAVVVGTTSSLYSEVISLQRFPTGFGGSQIAGKGAIYSSENGIELLSNANGDINFRIGPTANSLYNLTTPIKLTINSDDEIIAPRLTNTIIDNESTGNILVTRNYITNQISNIPTQSLEFIPLSGTISGSPVVGDILLKDNTTVYEDLGGGFFIEITSSGDFNINGNGFVYENNNTLNSNLPGVPTSSISSTSSLSANSFKMIDENGVNTIMSAGNVRSVSGSLTSSLNYDGIILRSNGIPTSSVRLDTKGIEMRYKSSGSQDNTVLYVSERFDVLSQMHFPSGLQIRLGSDGILEADPPPGYVLTSTNNLGFVAWAPPPTSSLPSGLISSSVQLSGSSFEGTFIGDGSGLTGIPTGSTPTIQQVLTAGDEINFQQPINFKTSDSNVNTIISTFNIPSLPWYISRINTNDNIYNSISLQDDATLINYSNGVISKTFSLLEFGATIGSSDNTDPLNPVIDPNFEGLKYMHDYSGNYTNRSIPDIEWVNNQISNISNTASYNDTSTASLSLDCNTFDSLYQVLTVNTDIVFTGLPPVGESFEKTLEITSTAGETLTFSTADKIIGTFKNDNTIHFIKVHIANYPTIGTRITINIDN